MSDANGQWIKIIEINRLIKIGALNVDYDRLENHLYDTRIIK